MQSTLKCLKYAEISDGFMVMLSCSLYEFLEKS